MMKNLKRNCDLSFQNWHKEILTQELESLKNLHLNGLLLTKVYNVWAKEVQFGKWHEEFGKSASEHTKFSKLGLSWDSFTQSRKCMSLKLEVELNVITMKNDAKFETKLTYHFKTDIRNLTNFGPNTQKSQKFAL